MVEGSRLTTWPAALVEGLVDLIVEVLVGFG